MVTLTSFLGHSDELSFLAMLAFRLRTVTDSILELTKTERECIREAKRWMQAPSGGECAAADFKMNDLKRAIKKMRSREAAGRDEVSPTFLKDLGPAAKEELLSIFKSSQVFMTIRQCLLWSFRMFFFPISVRIRTCQFQSLSNVCPVST